MRRNGKRKPFEKKILHIIAMHENHCLALRGRKEAGDSQRKEKVRHLRSNIAEGNVERGQERRPRPPLIHMPQGQVVRRNDGRGGVNASAGPNNLSCPVSLLRRRRVGEFPSG
jgi:hypothetical protein